MGDTEQTNRQLPPADWEQLYAPTDSDPLFPQDMAAQDETPADLSSLPREKATVANQVLQADATTDRQASSSRESGVSVGGLPGATQGSDAVARAMESQLRALESIESLLGTISQKMDNAIEAAKSVGGYVD